MYLPLTLIPLSMIGWTAALPVPENDQAAVVVPITSPTPTTSVGSLEKRKSVYASVETHAPILEVLAGSAANTLHERAGPVNSFDNLLCSTLKALKGENPTTFTSLLQSCTSLIDSSSPGRKRTLKERNVNDKEDLAIDVRVIDDVSDEAIMGRSETHLPGKRYLDIDNEVEKRKDEGLESLLALL